MRFFQHQDRARANTRRLLWMFAAAVAGLVVAIYVVLVMVEQTLTLRAPLATGSPAVWWNPQLFALCTAGTCALIGFATWLKIRSLGETGAAIAMSVGGRRVEPATHQPDERRLLNVVEEMAIAAGVPVPTVFVLDGENGINAFAAGYEPADAAVAVTRGALQILDRDELQGVIGHEFSHILNGDMRLNIRLIGILFGIMMIGNTGGWIVRSSLSSAPNNVGRREGRGVLLVTAVGGLLWLVGSLGLLAGRLIQRAVARQREFLADASAVQFTRDPQGLAGALKKIGGHRLGGTVLSRDAEELSHMFFGEAVTPLFGDIFATHPPLAERVRRLDPSFDGTFANIEVRETQALDEQDEDGLLRAAAAHAPGRPGEDERDVASIAARTQISDSVGVVTPAHEAHSAQLLSRLPGDVREAARSPFTAVALTYALTIDRDPEHQDAQLATLRDLTHPHIYAETLRLIARTRTLDPRDRLPVIELCAPALRQLSTRQRDQFLIEIRQLVDEDQRTLLYEYAIVRSLKHWLTGSSRQPVQFHALRALRDDISIILSCVARAGHGEEFTAQAAFNQGRGCFRLLEPGDVRWIPDDQCPWGAVDRALGRIRAASPVLKRRVLDAAWQTVSADGKVTVSEGELLRVIGDAIGCPLPPLLLGAPGAAPPSGSGGA